MWPTIKPTRKSAFRSLALAAAALAVVPAGAIDTDLYGTSSTATAPNVLFVIDNSSSYANNSQEFPDPDHPGSTIYQGQAELQALMTVIPQLTGSINIGLMEFVTKSNGDTNGGFVRYKIRPMGPDQAADGSATNQSNFITLLGQMKDRLRNPDEKTDDNSQQYGMMMADAYAYFGGTNAYAASSRVVASYMDGTTQISMADPDAYASLYSKFNSPLSTSNSCAGNYIIFIGNTKPKGPSKDDTTNLTALGDAGGDKSQLPLPKFTISSDVTSWTDLGYSSSCYATAPSGTPVDYASQCQYVDGVYTNPSGTYDVCQYNGNDTTSVAADCPTGSQRYQVYQTKSTTSTTSSSTTTTSTSSTNSCYASTSAWTGSSDYGSLTCPTGSVTYSNNNNTKTTVTHSCSYSLGAASSSCSGVVSTSSSSTNSCYASSSAVSSSDIGNLSCPSGAQCSYAVSSTPASTCSGATVTSTSTTNSCYASNSTGTDYGSLSCPSGYTCTYSTGSTSGSACANPGSSSTTTTGYYTSAPTVSTSSGTVTSPATSATLTCPTGYSCSYSATSASSGAIGATSSAYTYSCYSSAPSLTSPSTSSSVATQTALTCPANAQCTYTATQLNDSSIKDGLGKNCGANGSTGSGSLYKITQTVQSVKYTITQTPDSNAHYKYTITQTATPVPSYKYTVTQTATTGTSKYAVTMTDTATTTVETTSTSDTSLGNTTACYTSLASCSTGDFSACSAGGTCYCSASGVTNLCPSGTVRYKAQGGIQSIGTQISNPVSYNTDTATWNADEWARFMSQIGVNVPGTLDANTGTYTKATISTYTIDVYNKKPSTDQSSLMSSMATNGGGRYFSAKSEDALISSLKSIFSDILAVNSTYASAALPISATNRAQNDNQVYIPVFRPDKQSLPRWYGNMKRYQLGILSNGNTDLVDVNKAQAVDPSSGFISPCAQSFWTIDSDHYWGAVSGSTVTPTVFFTVADLAGTHWVTQNNELDLATKGGCVGKNVYSDLPDGPFVEKGAAGEMVRNQTSRNMKTLTSSATLVDFNTSNVTISNDTTINQNIVNYIRGQDVTGEIGGIASTSNRPSIHGDVVHSRPLPIDYGTDNGTAIGVRVYYGVNDGTFRSVNGDTGQEEWSFVAPEFYSGLQRLLDNSPIVKSPSPKPPAAASEASGTQKSFYFDGSSGLYQNKDNSKVWIYPVMRRGGRMIYAFDVSKTNVINKTPGFKWKFGCPNLTDDTGCGRMTAANGSALQDTSDTDLINIGQTWSTPNVAFLKGYGDGKKPVLVVGGGYDTCEDADAAPGSSTCPSPKGARIYILDGDDGSIVAKFTTDRSVAGDVVLVDVNQDGQLDLAYAADTGGNIYRINFSDPSNNFASLDSSKWTITKVAYTSGGSRKFLFAPAVVPLQGMVYVAIGSGDREHPTKLSYPFQTPVVNRFYVYLDDPTKSDLTNLDTMADRSTSTADTCSTTSVVPNGSLKGWFMSLTEHGPGEQVVSGSLIEGGMVTFNTNRPFSDTVVCSNSLGDPRGYWVNLLNGSGAIGVSGTCGGTRSASFKSGGLPPTPVTAVVTINGVPQNVVIGAVQRDGTTSSVVGGQKADPTINAKRSRIYWHTSTDTR